MAEPGVLKLARGRTTVSPGAGNGMAAAGDKLMLVKKEPVENPAGVGIAGGVVNTSTATVVLVLTALGGNVTDARAPKD